MSFLLFFLYFLIPPSYAHICNCVLFNSSGTFHSPDFPLPLGVVECLFYHFEAPVEHTVHIIFHSFQLPQRRAGKCTSGVRLFDHSNDGFVEINQEPDFEFCDREMPVGKSFYSRDRHFLLQISHADASSKGFVGEYRFLPKVNYTSEAVEVSEWTWRVEKPRGLLYSPEYPYFYPSFINATYVLPQRKGYHTVLVSNDFDLAEEAILEVFETSNKGKVRLQSFTSESHSLYLSSASSLFLHFRAGRNDRKRARGLVIEFSYEAATWSDTATRSSECVTTISSENGQTGNFSSRQFNNKGGSHLPSKCRVVFQGFPKERISVKFVYFNLFVPDDKNNSLKCSDVDHLTADVRVGSRLSRIDDAWCGSRLPPNLMSSTNMMQLEYTTKSSRILRESSSVERGFHLQYRFHFDWNMGNMQAKVDKSKTCRFIFNSSVQSSGKLWSVNHPGLYPRNLYCEYIFHGKEDQIVHIHFEYFDVEGFNQCDETTQSDYVLFSNYQTHDRTNRRFCGKIPPRGPILSESNYFRMIFFTNDIFDATGFYAHYQFISQQKSQISRIKLTPASSSQGKMLSAIISRNYASLRSQPQSTLAHSPGPVLQFLSRQQTSQS